MLRPLFADLALPFCAAEIPAMCLQLLLHLFPELILKLCRLSLYDMWMCIWASVLWSDWFWHRYRTGRLIICFLAIPDMFSTDLFQIMMVVYEWLEDQYEISDVSLCYFWEREKKVMHLFRFQTLVGGHVAYDLLFIISDVKVFHWNFKSR